MKIKKYLDLLQCFVRGSLRCYERYQSALFALYFGRVCIILWSSLGLTGVDLKKLGTIVAPFLTGGPGGNEAPSGSNSSLTTQRITVWPQVCRSVATAPSRATDSGDRCGDLLRVAWLSGWLSALTLWVDPIAERVELPDS